MYGKTLGFSLANKLKKKHILWMKHKMNVKVAAQTLSSSVASAIDFLCDEVNLPEFHTSEGTSDFIKKIHLVFDLFNSRNPFAQGNKQPFTKKYLPDWSAQCEKLAKYIFNLKDEKGRYLQSG